MQGLGGKDRVHRHATAATSAASPLKMRAVLGLDSDHDRVEHHDKNAALTVTVDAADDAPDALVR